MFCCCLMFLLMCLVAYSAGFFICAAAFSFSVQSGNTNYASWRVLGRINTTTSTAVRDTMFCGVATAYADVCDGGYNTTLYSNVKTLWASTFAKVSQNSKFPCIMQVFMQRCEKHLHLQLIIHSRTCHRTACCSSR